jgi:hypothetical protein
LYNIMALQTASLGQLPSMNLARYVPERTPIEPAWHKALTAFLVNTAGTTGKDLVGNAMAQDYTSAAQANNLPGAADTPTQSFWSQVLHGPEWDKTRLQTGMRDKAAMEADNVKTQNSERHAKFQEDKLNEQLGLSREQLASLNKEREAELALRQREQGSREADRKDALTERTMQNMNAGQDRRDQMMERVREWEAGAAERQARINEMNARTSTMTPQFQAQQKIEFLKQMGIDPATLVPSGNPTGNSQNVDFHAPAQQSVHGSPTAPMAPVMVPQGALRPPGVGPQTTASPMPPTVQSGTTDPMTAREAASRATAAGTSSQMGQSAQETPGASTPPVRTSMAEPEAITQPQSLEQHVGGDIMSLVQPPQTPNSPTAIQYSSPGNTQLPVTQDPDTMRRAAILARILGQAAGNGGTPQGGTGGLPLGYG